MKPAAWVLVALLLSGAALVGVELGKGALDEPAPKIADPCQPRGGRTGGIDTTIQRIVLDGLDGAACRLHTTREELVLSLGGSGLGVTRQWDAHTIEVALRAGPAALGRRRGAARRRAGVPGARPARDRRERAARQAGPRRDRPERLPRRLARASAARGASTQTTVASSSPSTT